MPQHHRIAVGSCSHPSLPQPLWEIVRAREPTAFVWGGDAVYADRFAGRNWTAVGLHRVRDDDDDGESHGGSGSDGKHGGWSGRGGGGGWRLTFPPPSVHMEATPDVIRGRYVEQWGVDGYRRFVEGWHDSTDAENATERAVTRPIIFGTIDDHDYGQNNGDVTYRYKRESNLAFMDFLYYGVANETDYCARDVTGERNVCNSNQEEKFQNPSKAMGGEDDPTRFRVSRTEKKRKSNDPMYRRALEGKGVYGVSLFDFNRTRTGADDGVLWGGGHWVPDEEAMIDPDLLEAPFDETNANYSATHSVAIFALDVRSNKTPWPKEKQKHGATGAGNTTDIFYNRSNSSGSPTIDVPARDFLGRHQWEWFRDALSNSRATVNVIVSGLQIHPERFPNDGNIIEEWSKFPGARRMLYDTILNSGARSPLLVSGDVHMAQFMRKDCVRSSDIVDGMEALPRRRPLVEVTTSGMTHSWGTSFSSQPRNHRLPLKLYTYLVSPIFMTVCHYVCPWNDILIRTEDNIRRDMDERTAARGGDGAEGIGRGGQTGKQYYLGTNFAEFEFDFNSHDGDAGGAVYSGDGGAVTVRIFGKQPNAPPKLETRWTFDQLSGNADMPGVTAKVRDFAELGRRHSNSRADQEWICVPHRGLPSVYHGYAANFIMFFNICFLFFMPHAVIVMLLITAQREWSRWKNYGKDVGKYTNGSTERTLLLNGHADGRSNANGK